MPIKQIRPDLADGLAAAIMKSLEKDRNNRYRLVEDFVNALLPFAPAWFRPPAPSSGRSVPSPALPAHLSNSLADSLEDERTVADPDAAPDALRPYTPPTHAAGAFDVTTQAPSPVAETSHPGAVARTTAGGDKNKNTSNNAKNIAIASAIGVLAGTLLLVGLYFAIQRTNANQAQPQPTTPVDTPPTYGRIAVSTVGGTCALRIDGVDRGALTTYDVVPGEHVVKCTTASGAVKEQRIQVSAGQTAKVSFTGP